MNSNVAFVTGYVGQDSKPRIPKKPKGYDSYYITNHSGVISRLQKTNWIPIFIENVTDLLSLFSPDSPFLKLSSDEISALDEVKQSQFYTLACKRLKVYPNLFLPKTYDFVVWSDNKFSVNASDSIKTINNWNHKTAMMLHKHPFVENNIEELSESMHQQRYVEQKARYQNYLDEQTAKGLSVEGTMHYQCGYLLYNEAHPKTNLIRSTWQDHINMCGINDQISFHFVAQLFDDCVEEFIYPISRPKINIPFLSFFR